MAKAKKAEETAEQLEAQGEAQEKTTAETAQQEKPKTVIYVGPPVSSVYAGCSIGSTRHSSLLTGRRWIGRSCRD